MRRGNKFQGGHCLVCGLPVFPWAGVEVRSNKIVHPRCLKNYWEENVVLENLWEELPVRSYCSICK